MGRESIVAAAMCVLVLGAPALAKGKHDKPSPGADLPLEDAGDLELAIPAEPPTPPPAPKKEAPAPPPMAPASKPAPAPRPPPAPEEKPAGLRLSPTVAFGQVQETTLDTTQPVFAFGLGLAYDLNQAMALCLDVGDRLYERTYWTNQPDLAADGPQTLDLSEHDLHGQLLFAYDLGPMLKVLPGHLHLAPVVGFTAHLFANEVLPVSTAGVGVGARGSVALSDQLEVGGQGVWTYNLLDPILKTSATLDSALGAPLHDASLSAYVGLKLAPKTAFRLGYAGEIVTLDRSYRVLNTLAFTFDVLL